MRLEGPRSTHLGTLNLCLYFVMRPRVKVCCFQNGPGEPFEGQMDREVWRMRQSLQGEPRHPQTPGKGLLHPSPAALGPRRPARSDTAAEGN